MPEIEALDLARLQFASTVMFHIIFLALSIGIATWLAIMEGLWLKTGNPLYRALYHYWVPHFTLNYAAGVVSGVIMAFEFGTNWSGFARHAGGINGVLLSLEVMTAFFLEAAFFGVMVLGEGRVSRRMHFTATCMVALGAYISTFWILSSNSWMHTPAGYALQDGQFIPANWWRVIFNPSQPYRFVHMLLAALITSGFAIASLAAWHLLKNRRDPVARKMLSIALWLLTVTVPLQIIAGDLQGLSIKEYQPVKLAAMEGYWRVEPEREGMPMTLIAWPDMETAQNRFSVEIPYLSSLYLTHSLTGKVQGLENFPRENWPNVPLVFWAFRVMIFLGFAMAGIVLISLWLRYRGQLYKHRWFLYLMVPTMPIGAIAMEAGWVTTESGRQPWIIYGLLRTADGVSGYSVQTLAWSLITLTVVYTAIFTMGAIFFFRIARKAPQDALSAEDRVMLEQRGDGQ